ncbi:MAG TPA: PAS domain S-box protein, partial [Bradyrhizobium sp.]|nr:PAS domain S-box protein [Bradyrhizobium sp.]
MAFVDQSISAEAPIELARRLRHMHCLDWTQIVAIGDRIDLQSRLGADGIGLIDALLAAPLDRDELIAQTRATRRLMALRRAYRSTLDRVSEAAIVIDERGRVHEWNAAAQRLFQWGAGDMLGQSIKRLMPQEIAAVHDEYVGRYLRTGQGRVIGAGRIEIGLRRDGSRFPMQLTVSDVGDSGRVRFIGVVRDLTPDHERAELQHRA